MKLALFSLLLCVGISSSFPSISGKTLNDKVISIPDDTSDKVTLVGMAYSKKAEGTLKSWFMPLYDKFVLKRGMFDKEYDINLYFVPMFTGLKKSAYENAYKKLKESNRKTLFDNIVFYKGDLEPYKTELGLNEKEKAYLFLLDTEGNIIHKVEGKFTEGKLEALEEAIPLN